ncbi:hypothetical protein TD95_001707 [Thielaviopsis punctulata]|uniref:Pre-mRNA-splicing factor cwc15 n=1 Tax=Thielaviopsis punctulata TaxID=72032 RepID=A0A0F4Z8U8_9PEZI|nr:hypothetical protein TD95_001707 [Thielaviopsis punctulata]
MTTAHRPTFDPARGKEALRGPGFHQRLLPAYTKLKYRQPGQGASDDATEASAPTHDMRAELLAAEAAHFAKKRGGKLTSPHDEDNDNDAVRASLKRSAAATQDTQDADVDDLEAKRRRVLEESRAVDADSDSDRHSDNDDDGDDSEDSDDDSGDESDDSEAELQRELERVRREKAEKKAREERERALEEEDERAREIALGNPLLNKQDFSMKRRWNDDVVFKNQARGTEDKGKKEFVNDMLRSDFHRRFMNKYVR